MMELHRWLRYALPGALFEITFGLWLYLDSRAYKSYPALPEFDTATDTATAAAIVAATAAATLPIGFVLSVLMHTILWRRHDGWPFRCNRDRWPFRLWCRHDGWPFRRIDAASILVDSKPTIEQLLQLPSDDDLRGNPEQAHAYLDAALHLDAGPKDRKAALDRVRGMLDLMNGLATGFTAILVSSLSILGTLAVTVVRRWAWSDGWDSWRLAVLIVALVVSGFLACVFLRQQHRVTRITNHYLRALLVRPTAASRRRTSWRPARALLAAAAALALAGLGLCRRRARAAGGSRRGRDLFRSP